MQFSLSPMAGGRLTQQQRQQWALYIALAFHVSGFIAIGIFKAPLFVQLTPLNLLVCLALIVWTQAEYNSRFWLFAVLAFVIGYGAEYMGVTRGWLFGSYQYGTVLGPGLHGVPWLIGVQWLVTMYSIGMAMHLLQQRLLRNPLGHIHRLPRWWKAASLVLDGAMLAVVFDWVLEPVAIWLGYWQWKEGEIPFSNYLSWYFVSAAVLFCFHRLRFAKHNLFAVHLLLIQFMFFLLLRTVLVLERG